MSMGISLILFLFLAFRRLLDGSRVTLKQPSRTEIAKQNEVRREAEKHI